MKRILLLFSLLAFAPTFAAPPKKKVTPKVNHSQFESVTGESADDDKSAWDSFYKTRTNPFGHQPVSYLKEKLHLIPKGRAFVPAMGEGRNAIYLAKNGFQVEGVDISEIAVQKALVDAKTMKVSLKGVVGDLNHFHYQDNFYDLIVVSLFYDKPLMTQFKRALKKGGYMLVYNKLEIQDNGSASKNLTPDDFFVKSDELKDDLKDFQIKDYREYKDQGIRVAAILAKKP